MCAHASSNRPESIVKSTRIHKFQPAGMGASKLRIDADLDGIEEAQEFLDQFHALYPRVTQLTIKLQLLAVAKASLLRLKPIVPTQTYPVHLTG